MTSTGYGATADFVSPNTSHLSLGLRHVFSSLCGMEKIRRVVAPARALLLLADMRNHLLSQVGCPTWSGLKIWYYFAGLYGQVSTHRLPEAGTPACKSSGNHHRPPWSHTGMRSVRLLCQNLGGAQFNRQACAHCNCSVRIGVGCSYTNRHVQFATAL